MRRAQVEVLVMMEQIRDLLLLIRSADHVSHQVMGRGFSAAGCEGCVVHAGSSVSALFVLAE